MTKAFLLKPLDYINICIYNHKRLITKLRHSETLERGTKNVSIKMDMGKS